NPEETKAGAAAVFSVFSFSRVTAGESITGRPLAGMPGVLGWAASARPRDRRAPISIGGTHRLPADPAGRLRKETAREETSEPAHPVPRDLAESRHSRLPARRRRGQQIGRAHV